MFQKNLPAELPQKPADTVVGASVHVDGNVIGQGNIIIEGIVQGNVKTEHNVRVGERAHVKANVRAHTIVVAGTIQGNIKAKEKLELSSSAKVYGDIDAKVLSIAPGAVLNGKCTMTKDAPKDILPTAVAEEKSQTKEEKGKRGVKK